MRLITITIILFSISAFARAQISGVDSRVANKFAFAGQHRNGVTYAASREKPIVQKYAVEAGDSVTIFFSLDDNEPEDRITFMSHKGIEISPNPVVFLGAKSTLTPVVFKAVSDATDTTGIDSVYIRSFAGTSATPIKKRLQDFVILTSDGLYNSTVINYDWEKENRIRVTSDIEKYRDIFIDWIYGGSLPTAGVDTVTTILPGQTGAYLTFTNLLPVKKIDRLSVNLPGGYPSRSYHIVPADGDDINKLFIVFAGHDNNDLPSRDLVSLLVRRGYHVLYCYLPIMGEVDLWATTIEHGTGIHPGVPDTIIGNTYKLFGNIALQCSNYIKANYTITDTYCAGYSGGGWNATFYAAIDTTVSKTFAVAGITEAWEVAYNPSIGRPIFTKEMMVLAGSPSRAYYQIRNADDTCCHFGYDWRKWSGLVKFLINAFGGDYEMKQYWYNGHGYTQEVYDYIISKL